MCPSILFRFLMQRPIEGVDRTSPLYRSQHQEEVVNHFQAPAVFNPAKNDPESIRQQASCTLNLLWT
jgi:hypothetical protein